MAKQIEFYFDYGSPFSYLADTQLPALAQRNGAEIVYRRILLGGIFMFGISDNDDRNLLYAVRPGNLIRI